MNIDTRPPVPEPLLDQDAVARILNLRNARTLASWRLKRRGPPFVRLGGCIRYRRVEVLEWLEAQTVRPEAD